MPGFTYKALRTDGSTVEGHLEAAGRQDALREMERLGLRALRLAESSTRPKAKAACGPSFSLFQSRRVRSVELENFTRLLANLLASGIPLSRALVILHKEASSPAAARQWKRIHDLVVDGVSLADAMGRHPETFPKVYVAMVEAGETGGFLDLVLEQIAEFQSRDKELRAKVTAAMVYPAVLLTLAIAVLIFLMVFFIPRFQTLFEGFDAALPALTQVIVGTSHALRAYGLYGLAGLTAAGFALRGWFTSDQGRRRMERILLQTPAIGALLGRMAMARFCRMLGTLLKAGVPLIAGLNVARRSLGYQTLTDAVSVGIEQVKKGQSLATGLASSQSLFSGATHEMIAIAEESGRLDQELIRLADSAEKELDRRLKTAVSFAEPIMLFFIAGFIGTIFIGMVIPIFTIQDYIQ